MTPLQIGMTGTLIGLMMMTLQARAETPVQGNRNCAARAVVVDRLTGQFGETRRSVALGSGRIVEVFASDSTGTWTITITLPSGLTCVVAAGTSYETVTDSGSPAQGRDA